MFNDEAYTELKKNKYYKIFAFNCYLGIFICYTIVMLLIMLLLILISGKDMYLCILECCLTYYVPAYIIGVIAMMTATGLSLKKKPWLCSTGKIKSVSGSKATVEVDNKEIKGTSFEHFVKSKSLGEFSEGDEVIIYSSSEKCGRPLFFKK